ncbi:hypothetical protein [Nakamurella deserti]|uniref:hypothetical protein n=1 Tax=Nakamurella deserti TaxID=2164074 RepID=UPI000DBE5C6A|nr:hypothetical protein [Nakamurella deserti]
MTDPPPMGPVDPPPPPELRGSRRLGIILGVVYVAVVVSVNLFTPVLQTTGGMLLLVPLVVLVVAAVVLVAIPRTAGLGSGLLLGFGIALLVGAGVCVALVAGLNR